MEYAIAVLEEDKDYFEWIVKKGYCGKTIGEKTYKKERYYMKLIAELESAIKILKRVA